MLDSILAAGRTGGQRWAPLLVLAAALVTTLAVWHGVSEQIVAARQLRFEREVHAVEAAISDRLRLYENSLLGARALFAASRSINREEWRAYVEKLDLHSRYPGILGLGFSLRIDGAHLEEHVATVREDGFTNYAVHPSFARSEYHSILYLEPFHEQNRRALGFDMYSEPVRRAAMDAAWDSGMPAISGKVALIQDAPGSSRVGFLMYVPIYAGGIIPATQAGRRQALQGFVYSPFRMGEFMDPILGTLGGSLRLRVFDGEPEEQGLLFETLATANHEPDYAAQRHIQVAGRTWVLEASSQPNLEAALRRGDMRAPLLVGGMLISLLLAAMTWSFTSSRGRAIALARKLAQQFDESRETYNAVAQTAKDAIITADAAGCIVQFNGAAEEMFGYSADEVRGKPLALIIPQRYRRGHEAGMERLVANGQTAPRGRTVELSGLAKGSREFPIELSTASFNTSKGLFFAAIIRDITARKETEEQLRKGKEELEARVSARTRDLQSAVDELRASERALRASEQLLNRAQAMANMAHIISAPDGRFLQCSDSLPEVLGVRPENCPRSTAEWLQLVAPSDRARCRAKCLEAARTGARLELQYAIERADGSVSYIRHAMEPLEQEPGKDGRFNWFTTLKDVTERVDAEEKAKLMSARLDYLASYDAVTGLANRRLFMERLAEYTAAARAQNRRLAMALVDVDRFKSINDTHGWEAGDELLRAIAERFIGCAPSERWIGKVGPNQFAVAAIGIDTDANAAALTEKRLLECFGPPFRIRGTDLRISAKVGLAFHPDHGATEDALYRNAEAALKRAKTTRQPYVFYDARFNEHAAERVSLENRLRSALENDEFVLHYQPKINAATRAVTGVEALIRWRSADRGLVPPGKFIPVLEETGLILEVGAWALRRAASDHKLLASMGFDSLRVAVNISAVQVRHQKFLDTIVEALGSGDPAPIDLEITESVLMEDIDSIVCKLQALRKLGVRVAMDDFGTGYSSLAYLSRLPVETLKIDKDFVARMLRDADCATLVSTIISLAKSLNLKVVAEGVETEEQARILAFLRCDEMQGFLFSKPLALPDLCKWLKKGEGAIPNLRLVA